MSKLRELFYYPNICVYLLVSAVLVLTTYPQNLIAAEKPLPPKAIYDAMLGANKDSGWVQFRNYNAQQILYFTALQTLHCRLKEIRYSLNSAKLDQSFPLVKCNSFLPYSLPGDAGLKAIAITQSPDSVKYIAVQVIWDDGRESDVMKYMPCEGVGDSTCATFYTGE